MNMEELDVTPLVNLTYEFEPSRPEISDVARVDIVVYSVLMFIGVCTNIWMLWYLYKTWRPGGRAHFYYLCICITDLIAICTHCALSIGVAVTVTWRGGNIGCKLMVAIVWMGPIVGHLTLAGFNIDNLITIIRRRSYKLVRFLVLIGSIILAAGVCIPFMIIYRVETFSMGSGNREICVLHTTEWINGIVNIALTIIEFLIPFLIMTVIGVVTLCLWCSKKGYVKTEGDETNADMDTIGKDIGTVTAFNILFVVFWSPWAIFRIIPLFSIDVFLMFLVHAVTAYMSVAYSCFIPVVFGICSCINRRREDVSPGL